MSTRLVVIGALCSVVLGLASCGGGSPDGPSDGQEPASTDNAVVGETIDAGVPGAECGEIDAPPVSVEIMIASADVIFSGQVARMAKRDYVGGYYRREITVNVSEVFRASNSLGDTVEVSFLDCQELVYPFAMNAEYLFFTSPTTLGDQQVAARVPLGYRDGVFRVEGAVARNEVTGETVQLATLRERDGDRRNSPVSIVEVPHLVSIELA